MSERKIQDHWAPTSHIRPLGTNIYGVTKNQNQDFEKLKDTLLVKIYIPSLTLQGG